MNYSESAEGQIISNDRAIEEIEAHGALADLELFYQDCGRHETYRAEDVLAWLGY